MHQLSVSDIYMSDRDQVCLTEADCDYERLSVAAHLFSYCSCVLLLPMCSLTAHVFSYCRGHMHGLSVSDEGLIARDQVCLTEADCDVLREAA